jgi:hypothetical protein
VSPPAGPADLPEVDRLAEQGVGPGPPDRLQPGLVPLARRHRDPGPRAGLPHAAVEGPPDVLRLAEAGYVGVALLGRGASQQQLAKLAALGKEIWISFDKDGAGRDALGRFRKKLDSSGVRFPMKVFTAPPPHKDLGDATADEIRGSVAATTRAEMPES